MSIDEQQLNELKMKLVAIEQQKYVLLNQIQTLEQKVKTQAMHENSVNSQQLLKA